MLSHDRHFRFLTYDLTLSGYNFETEARSPKSTYFLIPKLVRSFFPSQCTFSKSPSVTALSWVFIFSKCLVRNTLVDMHLKITFKSMKRLVARLETNIHESHIKERCPVHYHEFYLKKCPSSKENDR